jgi:hypothetical protein
VGWRSAERTSQRRQESRLERRGPSRDEYRNTAVLAGWAVPAGSRLEVIVSTGVSRVEGERIVGSERRPGTFGGTYTAAVEESVSPRIGIPIEMTLQPRSNRRLGLGLTASVNLNSEEVYGALVAQVQVRLVP